MLAPYLENNQVKLTLLDLSNYQYLIDIAKEKDLVYYSPSQIASPEELKKYVQEAVNEYYNGTAIPFIIYDKLKKAYAGSTRFANIDLYNKKLEIGWTWIGKNFQGTGINLHIKYLMLKYVFETLQFDKVQFRVDERNTRSRKAIEKIGGTLEGILKKDMLMPDGFKRNTCCYAILKEDWNEIKNTVFETLQ
ncbi:MAG TPA: GNAT family protein [Flavobacteriaceae bacterium]|nr:GNAT family protein [Flavobacteriaceae bacterium]